MRRAQSEIDPEKCVTTNMFFETNGNLEIEIAYVHIIAYLWTSSVKSESIKENADMKGLRP